MFDHLEAHQIPNDVTAWNITLHHTQHTTFVLLDHFNHDTIGHNYGRSGPIDIVNIRKVWLVPSYHHVCHKCTDISNVISGMACWYFRGQDYYWSYTHNSPELKHLVLNEFKLSLIWLVTANQWLHTSYCNTANLCLSISLFTNSFYMVRSYATKLGC